MGHLAGKLGLFLYLVCWFFFTLLAHIQLKGKSSPLCSQLLYGLTVSRRAEAVMRPGEGSKPARVRSAGIGKHSQAGLASSEPAWEAPPRRPAFRGAKP